MNLIKVDEIPIDLWKIGKKTKNLKAKPLATGDYILKSIEDPTDVWIVRQKLFNSTYEIIRNKL